MFGVVSTVIWLVGLVVVKPIQAADRLLWADTFEWFGLDQWEETFNGQLHDATLPCRTLSSEHVTWQVVDGQAELNIDGSVPCRVVLQPRYLENDLPSKWRVSFEFTPSSTQADANWIVRWLDKDNYLGFHIWQHQIFAEKVVNGEVYELMPSQIYRSILGDHTYQISLTYDEPARQIILEIDGTEVAQFQEQLLDPQLNHGRPGLAGSVGAGQSRSRVRYDNFRLWEVDSSSSTVLDLPLFMQTDSSWATQEYDSAVQWAPEDPSFGRWGCAVSSAAMVFRYFGLTKLPNGDSVTPGSLNAWLQTQADGYVGPGLLNWRALTRLSWQIKQTWETPALEFHFEALPDNPLVWLQTQLWRNLPVILAVPNHFVVAYGTDTQSTIKIRDPYYSYATLNAYDNTWLSARVFTPSHTDLSAITMWTEPGVVVWRNGERVQPWYEPYPVPHWIYDWPQPSPGTFEFQLENPGPLPLWYSLSTYDVDGSELLLTASVPAQAQAEPIAIEIREGTPISLIRPDSAWTPLTPTALTTMLAENEISSPFLIEWYQEQQAALQNAPDLPAAESMLHHIQQQLETWSERGWLTIQGKNRLQEDTENTVRQAWP